MIVNKNKRLTSDDKLDGVTVALALNIGGHTSIWPSCGSGNTLKYETLIAHDHSSCNILENLHSLEGQQSVLNGQSPLTVYLNCEMQICVLI